MPSYPVIISQGERNLSASAPDLPGCIAVGETGDEIERLMGEAMALHLLGLDEDGTARPEPTRPGRLAAPLKPHQRLTWLEPAPTNPVSLGIERAVRQSGLSGAEVARRLGTTRSVLSRLTDPFYWGHSLDSLRRLARALGGEVEVRVKLPGELKSSDRAA